MRYSNADLKVALTRHWWALHHAYGLLLKHSQVIKYTNAASATLQLLCVQSTLCFAPVHLTAWGNTCIDGISWKR